MKKAIFLDRDGVLNKAIIKNGKPYPPMTLDELVIPSDAKHVLSYFKSLGFLLIAASNQPDVARGTISKQWVETINAEIMKILPLDAMRVCYHDDQDQCTCRKPLPGLLMQAATDFKIDLFNSIMIGDRWKDIVAGQKAGCKTIWINHHYQEKDPPISPDFEAESLSDAKQWIQKTFSLKE